MEPVSEETRAKALESIGRFCLKPYLQHGKRRTKGERKGWLEFHDWGHLVLRLYHLYYGTMLDSATAATIAQPLRREYPHSKDWNKETNRAGAHEHIRDVVEKGIAALPAAGATVSETVT